jgi:hypothetical protein
VSQIVSFLEILVEFLGDGGRWEKLSLREREREREREKTLQIDISKLVIAARKSLESQEPNSHPLTNRPAGAAAAPPRKPSSRSFPSERSGGVSLTMIPVSAPFPL